MAVVAAAGGSAATVYVQRLLARKDKEIETRRTRRELSASVLAPIENLLTDANPSRLGINAGPQSAEVFRELRARWQAQRETLTTWGHAQPSEVVSACSERLLVAVSNSLTSAEFFVSDLLSRQGNRVPNLEIARSDHTCAKEILAALSSASRGYLNDDELSNLVAAAEAKAKEAEDASLRSADAIARSSLP